MEDVLVRISILWTFAAVTMLAHYALLFFEPDVLKETTADVNKYLPTMEAFTNWLIPMTMAFLTVTLEGLPNRYLNIVLGGLYVVLSVVHVARCPIIHISNKPSIHQLLLGISTVVVTALIFWYAWTWVV